MAEGCRESATADDDDSSARFEVDVRLRDGLLATSSAASPISPEKALKSDTLKRGAALQTHHVELSRTDLIRLLSYLEGELQARDVVIAALKAEKAKQLLYQAKYGRLGLNDPLAALQRDSTDAAAADDFDEAAVGRMYESQLAQLERLIAVQRRAHHRAKQVLASAERRHAKTVRELEDERQRSVADAAQGDDVCMMLEKDRERLRHEISQQKDEQERVAGEMEKAKSSLAAEQERHRAMVLYLINERKQLIMRLHEERRKHQQMAQCSDEVDALRGSVEECRRDADELRRERSALQDALASERDEAASLREVIRTQEEDLSLIRQSILSKTRQQSAATSPSAAVSPPSGTPTSPSKLPSAARLAARPPPAYGAPQRQVVPNASSRQPQSSSNGAQRRPVAPQRSPLNDTAQGCARFSDEVKAPLSERSQSRLPQQHSSTGSIAEGLPLSQAAASRGAIARPTTFSLSSVDSPRLVSRPPPPYDMRNDAQPVFVDGLSASSPQGGTSARSPRAAAGLSATAPPDGAQQQRRAAKPPVDSQRPKQEYASEPVEAEIAELEAVIDSLSPKPPALGAHTVARVYPTNRGAPFPLVVSDSSGVVKARSASLPRNGGLVYRQAPTGRIPTAVVVANGGARLAVGGRAPTPPTANAAPSRRPLFAAVRPTARKEKKSTQV